MKLTKKYFLNLCMLVLALLNFGNKANSQTNTPCSGGVPAATTLTVNGSCINTAGTTVSLAYNNGVASGGTPSCGFPGAPDGWYQFVAPASGSVTISTTAGTMTDGVMSLYSGTCSAFTELACNDNGAGMPVITYTTLTPGVTYFIRIWSYFSGTGTFSICVTSNAAAANPCTSITSIAACGTSVSGNLTGSGTWGTNACGFTMNGAEQIFSFTPATTGTYALNITSNTGGFIDYYWVNSTAGCSSGAGWTCIADVLSAGTYGSMSWTAGQTYYILVDAETTSAHTFTFDVPCLSGGGGGPCATPTNIVGCGASYSTTTTGTGSWSTNPCGFSTPGIETLYTYTATSTGNHLINITSISGGFIDFAFKPVSSGCNNTGWTCIDDVLLTGQTPTFSLTSGTQYYILVEPESTAASSVTFNLDCPGSVVTASDCSAAVNICSNATFSIDPNGYGSVMEIPALGTVGNPYNNNPGGSGNYGCLQSASVELNSTWMIVNIATSGNLEFSFGAGGAQAGFYDWIMYPYTPATTCADIPTGNYAPVRCNWNWASTGGTGLASTLPAGGNAGNYEPPLPVTAGQQYIICFSNYSSAVTSVPLNFFGTATVSCNPLPSELINFDGYYANKNAVLNWKTLSETNTSHFILKHSLDGIHFDVIGSKNAQGNSTVETAYDFTHENPVEGTNYYQLITVDYDSQTHASRIIQVEITTNGIEIKDVFPNPSTDDFSLVIHSDDEMEIEIEITDIVGKQIYHSNNSIASGENNLRISSADFAEGMYHLKVIDLKKNKVITKQIYKQK